MDFNKIFGKALRYPLRAEVYGVFLVVSLIFSVASHVAIGGVITNPAVLLASPGIFLGTVAVLWIISFLVDMYLFAVYAGNASQFFGNGRERLVKSVPAANARYLPLLGNTILILLIFGATVLIFGVPGFLMYKSTGSFFLLLGFLLIAGIAFVVESFFFFLSSYFVVLGKKGAVAAISSSVGTVRANKLNSFIFLLVTVVILILVSVVSLIAYLPALLLTGNPLVALVIQSFFGAYIFPFMYSAGANFFLSVKKK